MPQNLLKQVDATMIEFLEKVKQRLPSWCEVRDGAGFRALETDVAAEARRLADAITGAVLQHLAADAELRTAARQAARGCGEKVRGGGKRDVHVRLLGGTKVKLRHLDYVKVDRRGRPGRKRGTGKRGKAGAGFYPVLAALGITLAVTPALAGEICRQVTDSDSVRSGRQALDRRGIDLGHKETLRIVNQFSQRAVTQRNEILQEANAAAPQSGILSGQRVVVTTDGGRLRERRASGRGRRRATGHRRYDAPWREPKLIVIYVIDAKGEVVRKIRPIYDGTLGTCDDTFAMLMGYLRMLGAHEAKQLMLLGDGAKWIWARAGKVVDGLNLDRSKMVEVVDWCHAVSVLHAIAGVPKKWSQSSPTAWIQRAKKLLHAGQIEELVAHIQTLAVGRNARLITKHCDYFLHNAVRMQYADFTKAHVPTGSGAVESAVRRVVNMRMKSNGMFWLEVNAEGMLLLRSYLKSDRFDELVDWSVARTAPWWNIGSNPQLCVA